MRPTLAVQFRRELVAEAHERALQRLAVAAPQPPARARGELVLGLDVERPGDPGPDAVALEDDPGQAGGALVLARGDEAVAGDVAHHPLRDAAVGGVVRAPRALQRPVVVEPREVAEAVHPRRPARPVVPELLDLEPRAFDDRDGLDELHN